jgi:hypothetical protein
MSARFNRSKAPIVTRICLTLLTTTSGYFPDELVPEVCEVIARHTIIFAYRLA